MRNITVWKDTEPGLANEGWIVSVDDDETSSDTLEVCASESEALAIAELEASRRGLSIIRL